ncbi:MAG: hypothetical protein ACRECN_02815, partial [Methylocella sp.]
VECAAGAVCAAGTTGKGRPVADAWASATQICSRKQVTLIIGVFSLIAGVDWELPHQSIEDRAGLFYGSRLHPDFERLQHFAIRLRWPYSNVPGRQRSVLLNRPI